MSQQTSQRAGTFVVQQSSPDGYSAFIPKPLPPEPPLAFDNEMQNHLEKANRALGRLDGASYMLPDIDLFLYMFIRKEALLSSQIEGTQASLAELLEYENNLGKKVATEDVKEVSNYTAAMQYGLKRLEKLPISSRLIREIHRKLLTGTRGSNKSPGNFRRIQNWIGGNSPAQARFVPPPPQEVEQVMNQLERFIHNMDINIPPLIKAGLVHAQFETIHPFLDGNGRVGRLLITLILCSEKILEKPLLYLSLFFKRHREIYYERLNGIRLNGDWEAWMKFYLQGVYEISREATEAARKIMTIQSEHRKQINRTGKGASTLQRLLDILYRMPIISAGNAASQLQMSTAAIRTAIEKLEELGIVKEISGKKRDRLYAYQAYLDIITEGTELEDY